MAFPSADAPVVGRGDVLAVGLAEDEGEGEDDGDEDGPARRSRSAASRSHTRYPSSAPFRDARWPATPVTR